MPHYARHWRVQSFDMMYSMLLGGYEGQTGSWCLGRSLQNTFGLIFGDLCQAVLGEIVPRLPNALTKRKEIQGRCFGIIIPRLARQG